MRFDLLRFFRTAVKPYEADFTVDLSGEDFPGYQVPTPVQAAIRVDIQGSEVFMDLSVRASITAECARCLSPIEQEYSFTHSFVLKERELAIEDNDLPINNKGVLNLDELVFQELVMEVPTVLLCSPDCEGLCPICGKKKAAGCTCQAADEPAPVDPRLSILKQLLN